MKVIELLQRIANGEKIPLIKYRDKILHWSKEKDRFEDKNGMNTLYEMDFSELNDEVEIIEEDKRIEKLENLNVNYCRDGILYETLTKEQIALDISTLQNWINKIIKKLNEMENK